MSRKRKLAFNTGASLVKQFITLICGFVLPRLYLSHYGSSTNGLVSSITQFLSLVAILDAGMGVVIEASLFQPIADKNNKLRNEILSSAQKFYNKFILFFLIYVLILAIIYPLLVDEYNYLFTFSLIISISVSSLGQYCLGVTRSVILSADQKAYINYNAYAITAILNTILGSILIKTGYSIQLVKLVSSLVYTLRPLFLAWYVKKYYKINWHAEYIGEPIKQKWNGFAQHVSALVVSNTDIIVLTFLSTLNDVSIYSIYFLIVNGIKEIIMAVTSGFRSLFGDMLAKKEYGLLNKQFDLVEIFIHFLITILFTITIITICPFVLIYTQSVHDTNYNVPTFAFLICIAYMLYCVRTPYQILIMAAGHFKQTQLSSLVEAAINLFLSIIMVFKYGLLGVACGTLAAMLYRTTYLSWYLSKNIIYRSIKNYLKILSIDFISIIIMIKTTNWIKLSNLNYKSWLIMVGLVGLICFSEGILIYGITFQNKIFRAKMG